MDLKEFAENFQESIDLTVEIDGVDPNEEFVSEALEYIVDAGDALAPELCTFQHGDSACSAYDYDEEQNILSLYLLVKAEKPLATLPKPKISSSLNKLSYVFSKSMKNTLLQKVEGPSEEIIELQNLIQSVKQDIQGVHLFVITDGQSDYATESFEHTDFPGVAIERNVWDMQRLYQQDRVRAGKEKIEIDFPTTYGVHLQCLKIDSYNPDVDTYLAIIPGKTLAAIFKTYQQSLLEKNVRTFLQFKGKVNKGIRKTLMEEPDMFFSYNNGISTTATSVTLEESDGLCYIDTISGWQIVNGGQTTASIAAVAEAGTDLSKVNVAMKLSVIKDEEKANLIVPNISTSANSQTAIKNSDFSANDPYLVALESFSRNTWVPNGSAKPITKWYFERTRGQYSVDEGQQTGYLKRQFKNMYPKKQRMNKTELAKYINAWDMLPNTVCNGGEKNYKAFVDNFQKNPITVSEQYYKETIAKAILFNAIDKIVLSKKLGGYKANMNAYITAAISYKSKGKLNLNWIWEHQAIQPELETYIDGLIPVVWSHLTGSSSNGSNMANVGEWTKKINCWKTLVTKLDALSGLSPVVLRQKSADDVEQLTPAQQAKIDQAWAISSDTWYDIAKWAKANNKLAPLDRKMAFGFGTYKARNQMFTLKQAISGLRILEQAKELGY